MGMRISTIFMTTLDDVRTALNDRLKGIRMEYLPKTQSDRERAKAMIQAIEKMLKSRRIMRILERFVGGRLHRYSNPMIQSEPEGSTQGYPLVSVEVLRILKDRGEVKEFQRSFRHSDTERLSQSYEVLKLKNFKKDETLKLFKSTNQERYEHVGPEVTSSQDGQGHKMEKKRLSLVDDLKVFKITFKTS
ncbi:hypothetical protein Tco_0885789 [Tanacetum coccineum]